ncbi:MAG: hypothetical protein GY827_01900 [Cytophagales bacterium]|nr:hypothetical protein [Cytophagales bacterium]
MKKLILILFGSFLLLSSHITNKSSPIHADLMNVDFKNLKSIDSTFYNKHLKFHSLFLNLKRQNCKLYKKVEAHRNYDYWIIYKDKLGSDALVLFQIDKKTQSITNHKILSEIYYTDGASCMQKAVLYNDHFETIKVCENQLYENQQKQVVIERDTVCQKYDYDFQPIKK